MWNKTLRKIGRGFKAVGKGVAIGLDAADPFIEMGARMGLPFVTQIDAIVDGVQMVQDAMGDRPGVTKQAKVLDLFEGSLATTRAILRSKGQDLVVDQARVKAVIDKQVEAAKLQAWVVEETEAIIRDAAIVAYTGDQTKKLDSSQD